MNKSDCVIVEIILKGKKYSGRLPLKGTNEHISKNVKYVVAHTLDKVRPNAST